MQFVLNPKIEGLSQFFSIFLYYDMIVLFFWFVEVALRSNRLKLGIDPRSMMLRIANRREGPRLKKQEIIADSPLIKSAQNGYIQIS